MSNKQKVIIIGGGISGKLAARVLSDYFQEVIILERDQESNGPSPRKGAPQGEHLHALLHAGQYGLETLFPGITERFYKSGAVKINSTKDLAWFHHGVWKLRYDGGYSTTLQTRPHLEWHIEQYVKEIPNVSIHYNQVVQDYLYYSEENRIVGVVVKGKKETLTADLIVDASGVSSLSTHWFKLRDIQLLNDKVEIGLSYFSKLFELPESENRDWTIKLVYPNPPHETIGGTISKVEGNRYIVTIIGYRNEIQQSDVVEKDNGFLNLSKKLPTLDIYEEIKNGTPLSNTSVFRVPHISWKRFDRVKNLPSGLLLIGDTVCRIDPVFGQGMSIAILEALALQKILKNKEYTIDEIPTRFHKKEAEIIAPIWNMVIGEDFRYPGISGKKPIGLPIQQWYSKNIFLLSSKNQFVYDSFIKVMNLISPITILFHPRIIISLVKQSMSKR